MSISESHDPIVDEVLSLQTFAGDHGLIKSTTTLDNHEFQDCSPPSNYTADPESGACTGWFWDHPQFTAKRCRCLSVKASASHLIGMLEEALEEPGSTIMLDRAQILSHDYFGDENHWMGRRAMRFTDKIKAVADKFRKEELNGSTDKKDKTVMAKQWENHVVMNSNNQGLEFHVDFSGKICYFYVAFLAKICSKTCKICSHFSGFIAFLLTNFCLVRFLVYFFAKKYRTISP